MEIPPIQEVYLEWYLPPIEAFLLDSDCYTGPMEPAVDIAEGPGRVVFLKHDSHQTPEASKQLLSLEL